MENNTETKKETRSEISKRAWRTIRATPRRQAALKAWRTIRKNREIRHNAAVKAWETRRGYQTVS